MDDDIPPCKGHMFYTRKLIPFPVSITRCKLNKEELPNGSTLTEHFTPLLEVLHVHAISGRWVIASEFRCEKEAPKSFKCAC